MSEGKGEEGGGAGTAFPAGREPERFSLRRRDRSKASFQMVPTEEVSSKAFPFRIFPHEKTEGGRAAPHRDRTGGAITTAAGSFGADGPAMSWLREQAQGGMKKAEIEKSRKG